MKNFATKGERVKAVKILKGARELIKNGGESWVCTAISEAARNRAEPDADGFVRFTPTQKFAERIADRLRNNIRKAIAPHSFVDHWLINEKGVPGYSVTHNLIREYRINWIDAMIHELESQGV